MTTKERLGKALEEAGAPKSMIEMARAGEYDDFESNSMTPQIDLVRDLRAEKMEAFAERVINGEFDATKEEAEDWFEREGKDLI